MKTVDKLLTEKMMTLVRCNTQAQGQEMADALVDAGVKVIEITLTTPGALKIIEKLLKNKDLLVGAGTVRTAKDVKKVEAIGGRFIVSPDTNEDVIAATKKLKLVSMPGVSTPTEVGIAVDAGAEEKYHAGVFANQPAEEGTGFSDETLISIAESSGITGDALTTFNDCLASEKYAGWVANSYAAFDSAGVSSTPTGLLNGTELSGDVLFDPIQLTAAIEAAAKS